MPPVPPELPAGFQWVSDIPGRVSTAEHSAVPVLWPGDTARAARWARVLQNYGPVPALEEAAVTEAGGCVVSLGDTDGVSRLAAIALGREHHQLDEPFEAEMPRVPPGGSVLVVARASVCTFARLRPLLQRWARDGVRVGVLTGLDHAGMTFTLAKIVADRLGSAPSDAGQLHVDGTTGTAKATSGEKVRLAEALGTAWHSIALDAHGSGSHATLGPFMLCGLAHDTERLSDGTPLPGGCTTGWCRAGRGVLDQALMRDLQCRFLGLFVCNGITLSLREQFPSNVSLAFAALEGHAAHILGLLRQDADTSNLEPATALNLISSGCRYGEVAAHLSDDAAFRGFPTAYLLLGDPDRTQDVAPEPRQCHTAPWPDGQMPNLPVISNARGEPIHVVLTRHGPVLPSVSEHDHPHIADAEHKANAVIAELRQWLSGLDEASLIEDTLWSQTSATSKRKKVLVASLETMREHSQAARLLALRGLQQALLCRRRGRGAPEPVPHTQLHEHSHQWARALSQAADARAGAFRLWDALDANYTVFSAMSESACARCEAPQTRTTLTSPLSGLEDRVSVTCPRCGPGTHQPAGEGLQVSIAEWLRPGKPVEIDTVISATSTEQHGESLVSAQIQDRSGLAALDSAQATVPDGRRQQLVLAVPPDLTADLHRIWVLAVRRFRVSLVQSRIPAAPDTDATDTESTNREGHQ